MLKALTCFRSAVLLAGAVASDNPWIALSENARRELAPLSRPELMEIVVTFGSGADDTNSKEAQARASEALGMILRSGLTLKEQTTLVELASRGGPLSLPIFSSLPKCRYPTSATDQERQLTDQLLEMLAPLIEKHPPISVDAVMATSRTISHSLIDRMTAESGTWMEVPYGNGEATKLLLSASQHDNYVVREEAARGLGAVGSNDPELALEIVGILTDQIQKESQSVDFDDEQQRQSVIAGLQHARHRIISRVREFADAGGQLAEAEEWQSLFAADSAPTGGK